MALVDSAWYVNFGPSVGVYSLASSNNASGATLPLGSITVPAGALIVVVVNEASGTASGTLSDGGSNTYTAAASVALGAASGFATIFYAYNAVALNAATLTYTKQVSGRVAAMAALYATGVQTSSDPHDTGFKVTAGGTTSTPSVTSGTPATANELVIGALCVNNASALTYTQPASSAFAVPFAATTTQATAQIGGGQLVNTNPNATVTFNPTLSGTPTGNAALLVAFKTNITFAGYWGVTAWAASTVYAAGAIRRQMKTPAVGNERCFVCVVAGTSAASEPAWGVTRGAKTTDNTVTWQECTGIAALNGDLTNTPNWTAAKAATPAVLGQVIQRNNGASYQICTTAGAMSGSEPAFSDTAGTTTSDTTAVWTSLGAVGNFTGWQAPHARLANAYTSTWGQAGNPFYVGDNHAEIQTTALTATAPGTNANPNFVYCVDRTGSRPPASADFKATATITTTGSSSLNLSGSVFEYNGITFSAGSGVVSSSLSVGQLANSTLRFRNCTLAKAGTSGTSNAVSFGVGTTGVYVELNNTKLQFGSTTDGVDVRVQVAWKNTLSAIAGSTLPTTLFQIGTSFASLDCVGVDLSALGSGATLVSAASVGGKFTFADCKLGASVTIAATPTNPGNTWTDYVRCDNGGTNYLSGKFRFQGTESTETTIVRTGGASDGTTATSRKIVTTANSRWALPFEAMPIAEWQDSTSAATATLEGVWNAAALPNNDDVWFDVEYLGSASSPQGSFATGTKADGLAAGTPLTASTQAWDSLVTARANAHAYSLGDVIKVASNVGRIFFCTTAGTSAGSEPIGYAGAVDGGSVTDSGAVFRAAVRFKKTVSFQSGQKGYVTANVKAGKASSTFYIDPVLTLA